MKSESEIETELRSALRREPPTRDLTPQILARVRRSPVIIRRPRPFLGWLVAVAAACLLLAVGVRFARQRTVARQQAAAGRQLLQALRLAASDLSTVRQHLRGIGDGGD